MGRAPKALLALSVLAVAAGGAFVWWRQVWAPLQRAHQVAEVLSTRESQRLYAGTKTGALTQLWLTVRGINSGDYVVDRMEWASGELQRLAADHPRALVSVAAHEREAAVRFGFLDLVEDHPGYRDDVSFDVKLEHVASHVSQRLDRPNAKPMNEVQIAVLVKGQDDAIASLRRVLRAGHCGALVGFDAVGEKVSPLDLEIAVRTIARESADPLSALSPTVLDECRERFGALGAPATDGSFGVRSP